MEGSPNLDQEESRPKDRAGFPVGLGLSILVYLALRAAILVTAFEQVVMANYELYPMGTMAKTLALGADFPLYLYYDNAAGQLLTGLLAKLSFALFGDSYLALKLVPASLGLLTVIVVWALSNLLWGRRAAAVAAMAFALGPTELATKYSLFASGNHFENLFFISVALFCHYALQRATQAKRNLWLLAAGFSAGFSLFVFLGAIIPVGLIILAHLGIRGWRWALRDLRLWLPSFLFGLAPLVVLNLRSGGRAGGFLDAKFGKGGSRSLDLIGERLERFSTIDLFESGFHGTWAGMDWRVPSAALLICLAVAWMAALPSALLGMLKGLRGACSWERSPEAQAQTAKQLELVPLVLFAPLAALAFGLSDLRIDRWNPPLEVAGFRYFLPVFLTGILLLAALVGRTQTKHSWISGSGLVLAGVACLTGLWNLRYLDLANPQPTVGMKQNGYNFVQAARGLGGVQNRLSREERVAMVDSFPSYFRKQLYRGLGFHGAQMQLILGQQRNNKKLLLGWIKESALDLDGLVAEYPSAMHVHLARGAGEGLRSLAQSGKNGFAAMAPHMARLLDTGHPLAPLVLEGTAIQEDFLPTRSRGQFFLRRNIGFLNNVEPSVQPHLARGIGRFSGILLARDLPGSSQWILEYLNKLGGVHRPAINQGLVQGLIEGREHPGWNAELAKLAPIGRGERVKAAFEAAVLSQ